MVNYTFKNKYIKHPSLDYGCQVQIIVTDLDNIETKTINELVEDTSYIGINGGYFHTVDGNYHRCPKGVSSI